MKSLVQFLFTIVLWQKLIDAQLSSADDMERLWRWIQV